MKTRERHDLIQFRDHAAEITTYLEPDTAVPEGPALW